VFRFESAALVHPDCIGAVKLAQEILVLSIALAMAAFAYGLFWGSGLRDVLSASAEGSRVAAGHVAGSAKNRQDWHAENPLGSRLGIGIKQ